MRQRSPLQQRSRSSHVLETDRETTSNHNLDNWIINLDYGPYGPFSRRLRSSDCSVELRFGNSLHLKFTSSQLQSHSHDTAGLSHDQCQTSVTKLSTAAVICRSGGGAAAHVFWCCNSFYARDRRSGFTDSNSKLTAATGVLLILILQGFCVRWVPSSCFISYTDIKSRVVNEPKVTTYAAEYPLKLLLQCHLIQWFTVMIWSSDWDVSVYPRDTSTI